MSHPGSHGGTTAVKASECPAVPKAAEDEQQPHCIRLRVVFAPLCSLWACILIRCKFLGQADQERSIIHSSLRSRICLSIAHALCQCLKGTVAIWRHWMIQTAVRKETDLLGSVLLRRMAMKMTTLGLLT